ncbi:hypothetical protein ABPG74_000130 [Tetrahymena malaccensis]
MKSLDSFNDVLMYGFTSNNKVLFFYQIKQFKIYSLAQLDSLVKESSFKPQQMMNKKILYIFLQLNYLIHFCLNYVQIQYNIDLILRDATFNSQYFDYYGRVDKIFLIIFQKVNQIQINNKFVSLFLFRIVFFLKPLSSKIMNSSMYFKSLKFTQGLFNIKIACVCLIFHFLKTNNLYDYHQKYQFRSFSGRIMKLAYLKILQTSAKYLFIYMLV